MKTTNRSGFVLGKLDGMRSPGIQSVSRLLCLLLLGGFLFGLVRHGSGATSNTLRLTDDAKRLLEEYGLRDLGQTPEPPLAEVDEASSMELRAYVLGLQAAYDIRRKRFDRARKSLDEVAGILPDNYWIQLSLAEIDRRTLNDKRALEICDKLIRSHPDRIEAYQMKGQILESSGKDNAAMDVYSKALERWPNCDSLVRRQLDLAFRQGKLDLTIQICKRRLEREPKHFFTLWMLGYVTALKARESRNLSLLRESAQYYEAALEIRPRATKLYSRLAEVYQALSEPDKALATLRRGVVADPTDQEIRKAFERAASPEGDSDKILEAYRNLADEFRTAIDIQELYATQLLARQKYPEALQQFERLLELRPNHVKTLLALGALDLQLGKADQAKARFQRAVKLSGSVETYERIGAAYLSAKQYDEAAQFFQKALEHDPGQMAVYFGLARTYQEMGRLDKAIEVVRRGLDKIKNAKGRKALLMQMSSVHERRKEYDEAIANLRDAYDIDRTDILVFFRLADLLLTVENDKEFEKLVEQGRKTFGAAKDRFQQELAFLLMDHHRYTEAIPELQALKERNPDQWLYYVQLATAYQRLRQTANGERLYAEAHDRLGESADFYRFAARYHSMRYENKQAAEAVRRILDKVPPPKTAAQARERFDLYSSLVFNLARTDERDKIESVLTRADREIGRLDPRRMKLLRIDAFTEMKRYDEAIALAREMIDKEPEDPELYYKLGAVLNEARRIDEAEKALRKALELLPDPPETEQERDLRATVLNHLGYMFAEEGIRLREGAKLLGEALELEPRAGFIVDSMGWVQFKLGRIDKALELLQKALNYSSEDPVLYDHLGDAYARKGDSRKALEYYQQALRLDPTQKKIEAKIKKLSKKRP